MIVKIYTVRDAAVGAFLQPFFARSHGEAIRTFTDAVNDEKSALNNHPHDFSLWFSGNFDDSNATLDPPTEPERLLSGTEALIKDLNPKVRVASPL